MYCASPLQSEFFSQEVSSGQTLNRDEIYIEKSFEHFLHCKVQTLSLLKVFRGRTITSTDDDGESEIIKVI